MHEDVVDASRHLLDRFPVWQLLVSLTPGLVPYCLQYGYAGCGRKGYKRFIPVGARVELIGHNPATHHRRYGKWTYTVGLEAAVAWAMGRTQSFQLPLPVPSNP